MKPAGLLKWKLVYYMKLFDTKFVICCSYTDQLFEMHLQALFKEG